MRKLQPSPVIIGQTFGRVTILQDLGVEKNRRHVLGHCSCGTEKKFNYRSLKDGTSKSCGCYNREVHKALRNRLTHGLSKHPIFKLWCGMKRRCYNVKEKSYPDYGGRGILVCDEWLSDFTTFYKWALANGYAKGLQIDRRENDKGYSPDNCRFVTQTINQRNTRASVYLEYNGEKRTLAEWGEVLGMDKRIIWQRINRDGMSIEKALTKKAA